MDVKCGATVACERSEHATGVRRFAVHFRVEAAGYPAAPVLQKIHVDQVRKRREHHLRIAGCLLRNLLEFH